MAGVTALLAIGGNIAGAWGPPREALTRLPEELARLGVTVEAVATLIETPPFGPVAQPAFLNGALRIRTGLTPLALLAVVKALERKAGRKSGDSSLQQPSTPAKQTPTWRAADQAFGHAGSAGQDGP